MSGDTASHPFGNYDRGTALKGAAGFAIAGYGLYFLASSVGWGELRLALSGARLGWLAIACVSTLLGLAAWGKSWQVVLRQTGISVPYPKLVVTYFAATFANYVTPLGQAGGEPFIAYVLSRDTEASYEDSLASVVTADLLNLLPFFTFAAVGLGFLSLQPTLPASLDRLVTGLLAMAIGVPLAVVLGWRFRRVVEGIVASLIWPVARLTERVTVAGVRERVREFYASLDRIAANPRALANALVYSYTGWVFFALPLYFAAKTIGVGMEPLSIFFIVPASTLAGIVPTPGGLGAVEGALFALLVGITGAAAGPALALAGVYRLSSYWFALAVGGFAALWVLKRT
jgi:uncharacterized protein (TIRG00374 family)